jgi:thiosulfate/3-mercaptopyruvate sulfurtransferase
MSGPTAEMLVSKPEAIQILAAHAPEVLVLEIVSDYYQEPAVRRHRSPHPVPGFAQIKIERFETKPLYNLRSDAQLQGVLAEYSLVPETNKRILLFDNIQLACGRAKSRFDASARLFSILYYFGFSHISIVLDPDIRPSFPDEFAAQHPEVVHQLLPQPLPSTAAPSLKDALDRDPWIPKHKDHFVSYERMVGMLAGKLGSYRLLDARSAEEYAGISTGYDYVPLAGKIPTAESLVDGDYQVSTKEDLAAVLARLGTSLTQMGIGYGDRIVWYCGTGWRASRMCALTQALGYKNVGIYDGGWYEWQERHPGNLPSKR